MSFVNDDIIEVPIEISTKDKKELEQIKKDIDNIEKKTKKIKDTASRQAVPTQQLDERGGIFGGATETKGSVFKDKTSKQAITRENEFNKVKNELTRLEKAQKKADESQKQLQKIIEVLPIGGADGLAKAALKFAPFIGQALLAIGFIKVIIDELLRDGGFFDRRIKIKISKQFLKLTGRKEAAELSRARKTLRVTTSPTLRGPTGQVVSTQQLFKRGISFLSENQEALGKGVFD